uniref:CS domain-containing protein n=1 Tax=Oncorhynchus kisutch TaxID=8019 RepID=A0A8C7F9F4_ONCKI
MSFLLEERSGVIPCKTPRGNWSQTTEEVFIEVNVLRGTSGKEVKCNIGYKLIELHVKKATSNCADEDKQGGSTVLMKTNREGGNCWSSMLEGGNCADEDEQGGNCLDQMQRKLTLERFSPISCGAEMSCRSKVTSNRKRDSPTVHYTQDLSYGHC